MNKPSDHTSLVSYCNFVNKLTLFFVFSFLFIGVAIFFTGVRFVQAATLTGISDTLSNATANASSSHAIVFTTPTGITFGQTLQITFSGYANLGGLGTTSIDVLVGNSTTTAAQVNVNTAAGASQWGFATSTNVLTLTAPSSGSVPTAGQVVMINIGTNAVFQASGTQMLTNPAAGSYSIGIAGTVDSGTTTVFIISNAVVSITATVAQTLSFAILSSTSTAFSNSIYYGTLSSSNVKFASSTNTAGDTASTTAHTLVVSTNAPTGYTITMKGDTLRNQNATSTFITPLGGTATGGVVGTSQFGINVTSSGGVTPIIATEYNTTNRYGFQASSTVADMISYGNAPTAAVTYSIQYMANIPATQAAGAYSTAITYVGTANF
jgi:hypothetical protein